MTSKCSWIEHWQKHPPMSILVGCHFEISFIYLLLHHLYIHNVGYSDNKISHLFLIVHVCVPWMNLLDQFFSQTYSFGV